MSRQIEDVLSSLELPEGRFRHAATNTLRVYYRMVPTFPRLLSEILEGATSVLDLGCGRRSPVRTAARGMGRMVGVDLFPPYLKESRERGIHDEYVRADLRSLEFTAESFDTVICLSVLEHLTLPEGRDLIRRMESWSRRRIVLYTSNGFYAQEAYDANPHQEHISGWSASDFDRLGYRVIGVGGWKRVLALAKLREPVPEPLWNLVCNLSGLVVAGNPQASIDLCCVKDVA